MNELLQIILEESFAKYRPIEDEPPKPYPYPVTYARKYTRRTHG
jgi:hypothetical protein